MNIEQQFNLIAEEYDANRRKFIPCFDDFYQGTTKFIASGIPAPKRVLDLGAGTGLLSSFWFQYFPTAEYVLVDIAEDMLQVARKRFSGMNTVSCEIVDYSKAFPGGSFDVVVSALSIHHLENEDKAQLFARIYDVLPSGGVFVNYDQFCVGQLEFSAWFDEYWEEQLANSGLKEHDIRLWKERRKLDRECSVEQEIDMLRLCRFQAVQCVYSCQKFAVIAAIK